MLILLVSLPGDLGLHCVSLGSGSQSPLSVQVVEFGPVSIIPGAQVKFTVTPSNAGPGSLNSKRLIKLSVSLFGLPQLAEDVYKPNNQKYL